MNNLLVRYNLNLTCIYLSLYFNILIVKLFITNNVEGFEEKYILKLNMILPQRRFDTDKT